MILWPDLLRPLIHVKISHWELRAHLILNLSYLVFTLKWFHIVYGIHCAFYEDLFINISHWELRWHLSPICNQYINPDKSLYCLHIFVIVQCHLFSQINDVWIVLSNILDFFVRYDLVSLYRAYSNGRQCVSFCATVHLRWTFCTVINASCT